jgi:2-keto-4-pentenoate hydratase/2-oxohepta-3-ene-1,7-dioic acid hydratase in catechol pathway
MKLASFLINGRPTWGSVEADKVRPVTESALQRYPTLRAAIAADAFKDSALDLLSDEVLDLQAVELLLPIPDVGKIICVGRNYADHAAEAGVVPPDYPNVFIRFADSLVASGDKIILPKVSTDFDFEGEFAVIIGKGGRYISKDDALSHVFGWSCFNDGSIRDYQFRQATIAGKNFPGSGGFGPWIVTTDEIPDPTSLEISTRLNGELVQHSTISKLIFDIPALISNISEWTTLSPGDVIATGTPEGVGFARKPPLWMRAGDLLEVSVTGIGTLSTEVAAET